mgnify:CR=1 FL=1|tara:strand:- start:303 stop:746 length:444 start_codon:yes stop_codon:yes gene_type:complete
MRNRYRKARPNPFGLISAAQQQGKSAPTKPVSEPKTASTADPQKGASPKEAVPTEHFGDGTARTFARADGWTTYKKPVKRPKGETFKDLPLEGDSPSDCAGDPPPAGSWQDQVRKKSRTCKYPKKINKRKDFRTKAKRSKKRKDTPF